MIRTHPVINALSAALLGLTLVAGALAWASPAAAETFASEQVRRRTIHVPRDMSLSFRLPAPASKIVITQPEIAKVTATSVSSFYVQGIEFGSTNMLIYDRSGALSEVVSVRVGYDAEGLQQDLAAAFPNEPIRVKNLGESLMLMGDISNSGVQASAEKIAEKYAPGGVISRLMVSNSQQVVLEVRILEASRSGLQDLGVDLAIFNDSFAFINGSGLVGVSPPAGVVATRGGSGSTSIETQLSALEEKGVIRTLAKPNLVAISGQKASFLAGGEFPFPVPGDDNTVYIEFRPYGVRLNFLPVVQDNGWIRMAVEPEVSQLDYNNSLSVRGLIVPALTVRRANTTLELRPGDTFAMAGLFQHDYENAVQQTPWLGDVPVLGALFPLGAMEAEGERTPDHRDPRLTTPADRAITPVDALQGEEVSTSDLFLRGKAFDKPLPRDAGATPDVK